jgi:hypothetical membrane protein
VTVGPPSRNRRDHLSGDAPQRPWLRTASVCAGIVGPVIIVAGWLTAAALRPGFSSIQQAISQLARLGAPHRYLMTAAFVVYGVAIVIFALPLSRALGGQTLQLVAAVLTGLATIAVACCPLSATGAGTRDLVHGGFATTGYVASVASMGLGAIALRRLRHPVAAGLSAGAAVVATASLALTTAGHDVGLFQRTGLTLADAWFLAMGIAILRGAVSGSDDHRRKTACGEPAGRSP